MNERCKDCPVKILIKGDGIAYTKTEQVVQCCRFKKQLELAKKLNIPTGYPI